MKKFFSLLLAMLGLNSNTACAAGNYTDCNVDEFAQLIRQAQVQLLDVRTAKEFDEGHISGATMLDMQCKGFEQQAQHLLDPSRPVAVYCRSGKRSAIAAGKLADLGFKVTNLKGGIMAWLDAKKPTIKGSAECDVFITPSGKRLEFHALMHGSIRIVYDGTEIQVDPVTRLGDRTIDFALMPKADYILVTHEHADHFDKEAIATLSNQGTTLVTNSRCAGMLGYGKALNNGESLQLPRFSLETVPAYNTTEGHLQFHPKGRDNGFVLTIDGMRIYIAGDTEDIPEMAQLHDIGIAFLPCNQPYTMTLDQIVNATRMFKPKVLYPYHYGQTDVSSLPATLKADGIEVRIRHYE